MSEHGVTNVLVCGTGGQGVMTATEILAVAAIALGHDVKKTEVAGMAQRGGVVTSHLRFGPRVLAPSIPPGEADLLLAFEVAEGLRWCHHLRPGALAIVNVLRQVPPVVSSGLFSYPDDPIAQIKAKGIPVFAIDAGAIALDLGNPRLANTVMLGAAADHLPFGAENLRQAMLGRFSRKADLLEANSRAFDAGRAAVGKQAG